jgi:hypothetical protein
MAASRADHIGADTRGIPVRIPVFDTVGRILPCYSLAWCVI